jgi:hypothetical protein
MTMRIFVFFILLLAPSLAMTQGKPRLLHGSQWCGGTSALGIAIP